MLKKLLQIDIEKKEFNGDCLDGGYTKQACDCILNCLEIEYQNYKIIVKSIEGNRIDKVHLIKN